MTYSIGDTVISHRSWSRLIIDKIDHENEMYVDKDGRAVSFYDCHKINKLTVKTVSELAQIAYDILGVFIGISEESDNFSHWYEIKGNRNSLKEIQDCLGNYTVLNSHGDCYNKQWYTLKIWGLVL